VIECRVGGLLSLSNRGAVTLTWAVPSAVRVGSLIPSSGLCVIGGYYSSFLTHFYHCERYLHLRLTVIASATYLNKRQSRFNELCLFEM
jgi:hypothetical protein